MDKNTYLLTYKNTYWYCSGVQSRHRGIYTDRRWGQRYRDRSSQEGSCGLGILISQSRQLLLITVTWISGHSFAHSLVQSTRPHSNSGLAHSFRVLSTPGPRKKYVYRKIFLNIYYMAHVNCNIIWKLSRKCAKWPKANGYGQQKFKSFLGFLPERRQEEQSLAGKNLAKLRMNLQTYLSTVREKRLTKQSLCSQFLPVQPGSQRHSPAIQSPWLLQSGTCDRQSGEFRKGEDRRGGGYLTLVQPNIALLPLPSLLTVTPRKNSLNCWGMSGLGNVTFRPHSHRGHCTAPGRYWRNSPCQRIGLHIHILRLVDTVLSHWKVMWV